MKKQYTFLTLISIMLYVIFLIGSHKYKEYSINSHIEYISELNNSIRETIKYAEEVIIYKSSKAYKNMILKSDQSMKNKGEKVVYMTTEKMYNKFTKQIILQKETTKEYIQPEITDGMTNYQKWNYFLFKQDIR